MVDGERKKVERRPEYLIMRGENGFFLGRFFWCCDTSFLFF